MPETPKQNRSNWYSRLTPQQRIEYNRKRRGTRASEGANRVRKRPARQLEHQRAALQSKQKASAVNNWAFEVGKKAGHKESEGNDTRAVSAQAVEELRADMEIKKGNAVTKAINETWADASTSVGKEQYRFGLKDGYKHACEDYLAMGALGFRERAMEKLGYAGKRRILDEKSYNLLQPPNAPVRRVRQKS